MAATKDVGSKWRFESSHWDVCDRSGQTCEIVAVHDNPASFPFTIAFLCDAKRIQAVDRELVPLEATQ